MLSDAVPVMFPNQTHLHDHFRLGASDSTITIDVTSTVTKTYFSSTVLEQPTITNLRAPGCSRDCSFNEDLLTQQRNSWTKCPGTITVGRIHYIVDSANNKTSTSTSYEAQVTFINSNGDLATSSVSDILASGSHIITRADVNAAGTVTHVDEGHTM